MSASPGQIQANGTTAANTASTFTCKGLLSLDLHLDIVTAATITVSLTQLNGSLVNLSASKSYSPGDHVILAGFAMGPGDILSITSNQSDTTYTIFQSGADQPASLTTTGSTGAQKTSAGNQRVFATYFVPATLAAAQNVPFFVATRAVQVVAASCWFDVAAGGTSTLDVIKDTGTGAVASGSSVLGSTFNLNATARTTQTGTLSATAANDVLAAGDRLSVKYNNAIQATTSICVEVELLIL